MYYINNRLCGEPRRACDYWRRGGVDLRSAEAAARGEVARLADCRMAVAMDDADYDLDCRRAVGEGVSGGWQGADGGVVPRSGRNSAAGWFDGHRDEHEFICRDGDKRGSCMADGKTV